MAAKRRDYFKLKGSEAFQVDRTGAPLGELGISIPSLTDLTNFLSNAKKVLSDTVKISARLQSIKAGIGKIKNTAARNNLTQRFSSVSVKFVSAAKQLDIIRSAYSAAAKVINTIKGAVGLKGLHGDRLGAFPTQLLQYIPAIISGIKVVAVVAGLFYVVTKYLDTMQQDIAKQIEIEKIAALREKTRTEQDIFRKQEEAKHAWYMAQEAAARECPDLPEMSDAEYCAKYPNCCEGAAECPDLPQMSDEEYCARYPDCCEGAESELWGLEGRDQRWDNVPHVRRIGVKMAGLSARNRMYDNKPEHQVARIHGLGSSSDQNRMNRRRMGLEKARDQRWNILRQAKLGNIIQKLKHAMTEAGI